MIKKPEVKKRVKRIRVVGNYRVVHDGAAYVGGDMPEVPEALAREWLRAGWVSEGE